MAVVRCCRCERMIDLDYKSNEVFTQYEIPTLDVGNEFDYVCELCLTVRELEILEKEENK